MTQLNEPSTTLTLVGDLEGDNLYEGITQLWCGVFKTLGTDEWHSFDVDCVDEMLAFLDTATTLIFHNGLNFDFPVLDKLHGWRPRPEVKIVDTLVMSRLLNPDRKRPPGYTGKGGPHSMECWGYRVGQPKVPDLDWKVYSPEMLVRCKQDVKILELTYHTLTGEMVGHDWTESLALEQEVARIITEQERRGILFDTENATGYVEELSRKIQEIDDTAIPLLPKTLEKIGSVHVREPFLKTGGYRKQTKDYIDDAYAGEEAKELIGGPFTRIRFDEFNLGSIQDVKNYLQDNGWQPDSWNFSKTTGERTSPKLEGEFVGVDGELPRKVKERITWRHRRSQIEGWLKNVRGDGRISAGANPCGTNTGRMRHNTVVNIPKANSDKSGSLIWDTDKQKDIFGTQMRSLFICKPGYVIVGHDAAGLELRMLAHRMGDDEYIRQILHGDIHEYNRRAAGLPNRDAAKTFIYALIYGAGDGKLGSIVGGDAGDGARLRREFFDNLPKLEKLINSVKRASGKGYLKGLDGRKVMMRVGDDGRIQRNRALNTLLQSDGAIVMKKSMVYLDAAVKLAGIDGYKLADFHDEAQWEIPKERAEEYGVLAVQSLVDAGEYFNLKIPLTGEAKIGNNLAETH